MNFTLRQARSRFPMLVKGRLWVFLMATLAGCQSASTVPGPTSMLANQPLRANPDLPPVQSAQLCLQAARAFQQQGYDREAIVQYLRARQFDPSKSSAISRPLAVLYGRLGDVTAAMTEYDVALRAEPNDSVLLSDIGYFELSQHQPAVAEQYLRRATAADPHNARAWINLGLTLGALGQFDQSYAAFVTVISPAQAKANVGILLAQQGRYSEADAMLRQSLSLDPTLPQPQAVLQWVDAKLQPPGVVPSPPEAGEGGGT